MSTPNQKNALKNIGAFAKEQPTSLETKHIGIESIQSDEQTDNIVTENLGFSVSDASEDADAEISWLAKVFDPTVPKVEAWEEDWDTASESD